MDFCKGTRLCSFRGFPCVFSPVQTPTRQTSDTTVTCWRFMCPPWVDVQRNNMRHASLIYILEDWPSRTMETQTDPWLWGSSLPGKKVIHVYVFRRAFANRWVLKSCIHYVCSFTQRPMGGVGGLSVQIHAVQSHLKTQLIIETQLIQTAPCLSKAPCVTNRLLRHPPSLLTN